MMNLDFTHFIIRKGISKLLDLLYEAGLDNAKEYIYQRYLKPELKYLLYLNLNVKLLIRNMGINEIIKLMQKIIPKEEPSYMNLQKEHDIILYKYNVENLTVINEEIRDRNKILIHKITDDTVFIDDIKVLFKDLNDDDKRYILDDYAREVDHIVSDNKLKGDLPSKCGLYFRFDENKDYKTNWYWQEEWIKLLYDISENEIFQTIRKLINTTNGEYHYYERINEFGETSIDMEQLTFDIGKYKEFMISIFPDVEMLKYI